MTVYFEPRDRYNIRNYSSILLAQGLAKLLGDEFDAMRARATRAKNIAAGEKGGGLLNQYVQTPEMRAYGALVSDPSFLRMSDAQQQRLLGAFNFDQYLQATGFYDGQQNNIAQASTAAPETTNMTAPTQNNGGVIGEAIAPTSIVGQGVVPGSNRLGRQIAFGHALGIPTQNISDMHKVLAPELKTQSVNLGDRVGVLQSNGYTPGVTNVGTYKLGNNPDEVMKNNTEIWKTNKNADTNINVAKIGAGATIAAAKAKEMADVGAGVFGVGLKGARILASVYNNACDRIAELTELKNKVKTHDNFEEKIPGAEEKLSVINAQIQDAIKARDYAAKYLFANSGNIRQAAGGGGVKDSKTPTGRYAGTSSGVPEGKIRGESGNLENAQNGIAKDVVAPEVTTQFNAYIATNPKVQEMLAAAKTPQDRQELVAALQKEYVEQNGLK